MDQTTYAHRLFLHMTKTGIQFLQAVGDCDDLRSSHSLTIYCKPGTFDLLILI